MCTHSVTNFMHSLTIKYSEYYYFQIFLLSITYRRAQLHIKVANVVSRNNHLDVNLRAFHIGRSDRAGGVPVLIHMRVCMHDELIITLIPPRCQPESLPYRSLWPGRGRPSSDPYESMHAWWIDHIIRDNRLIYNMKRLGVKWIISSVLLRHTRLQAKPISKFRIILN